MTPRLMPSSRMSWVAAATLILGLAEPAIKGPAEPSQFGVTSTDVQAGKRFPQTFVANSFGCTGDNSSPQLSWSGVPAGTKSFVVTMFDPDEHGTPSGWWHWVVYDIPANVDHLTRNAGIPDNASLPAGALQGRNDDGAMAYAGPCPDAGDPPHHYVLTVYALKVEKLAVPAGASGANVTYTAHEFTLAKATLIARHARTPT